MLPFKNATKKDLNSSTWKNLSWEFLCFIYSPFGYIFKAIEGKDGHGCFQSGFRKIFLVCFLKCVFLWKGLKYWDIQRKHWFLSHVNHDLLSLPLFLQVKLERECWHRQSRQFAQGLGKPSLLFLFSVPFFLSFFFFLLAILSTQKRMEQRIGNLNVYGCQSVISF